MTLNFSNEQDETLVEIMSVHPSMWLLSHHQYKDQHVKDNIWADIAEKVGKPVSECKKRWRNIKDTYDRKKIRKGGSAALSTRKGKSWALEEKLSFLESTQENRGRFSNFTPMNEEEAQEDDYDPEQEISNDLTLSVNSRRTSVMSTSPTLSPPHSSPQQPFQLSAQESPRTSKASGLSTHRKIRGRTNYGGRIVTQMERRAAEQVEFIQNLLSAERNADEIDLFFQSMAESVKKLPPHLRQRAKLETLTVIGKLETEMWNSSSTPAFHSHDVIPSSICSTQLSSRSPSHSFPYEQGSNQQSDVDATDGSDSEIKN